MKILVVASNLSAFGGIQAYNRKLIDGLREEGASVRMVELLNTSPLSKARFVLGFFGAIVYERPDLVFATNVNFSPLAYFSKLVFDVPYTVTVYGIEVAPIRSALQKKALAQALLVVKLFDQAERDVVSQLPSLKGRIIAIPNSVDEKRFTIFPEGSKELRSRYDLEGRKVVLTICRISSSERDNKGYAKIIEAFPEVLKKVPEARYVLVGDGDDRATMISLVKHLGLEGKVLLPGAAKDEEVSSYYNLADVFVYVSKREGFPAIVLLEALACGTPVISGNQPDAVGSLFDGSLGLVVDPDDRTSIAEAIVRVLTMRAPSHFYKRNELRKIALEAYGAEAYQRHIVSFLSRVRSKLGVHMNT